MNWQPIETAPAEGEILVYWQTEYRCGFSVVTRSRYLEGEWVVAAVSGHDCEQEFSGKHITHWAVPSEPEAVLIPSVVDPDRYWALSAWALKHQGDGFEITYEKRAAFRDGFDAARVAFSAAQIEPTQVRADAERYRIIRDSSRSELYNKHGIDLDWYEPTENLDSMLDAAIAAKGLREGK